MTKIFMGTKEALSPERPSWPGGPRCGWHATLFLRFQCSDHGLYCNSHSGPGYVQECLFIDCGQFGIQMRAGGILQNCFIVQCPLGHNSGMTPSKVVDSVIMDPMSLGSAGGRGVGSIAVRTPDIWYDNTIFATKDAAVGSGEAVRLEYKDTTPSSQGTRRNCRRPTRR